MTDAKWLRENAYVPNQGDLANALAESVEALEDIDQWRVLSKRERAVIDAALATVKKLRSKYDA